MSGVTDMAAFWDARAREDAFFFVDPERDYRAPADDDFWARGERIVDGLLGELGVELAQTDDVLDLGCGVGRLTRAIAQRARHVVGVDVSAEMLARAPELPNVTWVHGDGRTLRPLTDGSVDAAISFATFAHLPDPDLTLAYVAELGRVLRPGGWAAFQVSTDPRVHQPGARSRRGPRGLDDRRWFGTAVPLDALAATAVEGGLDVERIVRPGERWCSVLARKG